MKSRLHVSAFSLQLSAFLFLLLAAAPLHAQSTWSDAGTDWGTPANWTGGVPDSTTATATFNGTISNQPSIGASNYTINRLNVGSSSGNVTLSGSSGLLTFETVSATATTNHTVLDIAGGKSLTIGANTTFWASNAAVTAYSLFITLGTGSVLDFDTGKTLTVTGGSSSRTLIINGNATTNFNSQLAGTPGQVSARGGGTLNYNPDSLSAAFALNAQGGSTINILNTNSTIGGISFDSSALAASGKVYFKTTGNFTQTATTTFSGNSVGTSILGFDEATNATATGTLGTINTSTNNAGITNQLYTGANKTLVTGNIGAGGTNNTLEKAGAGTVNINGTNIFTGTTLVTAGTLLVSTSTGTGNVTVSGGATLGGTGTIASTGSNGVTLNDTAILAPGDGTTGTLRLNSAGTTGAMLTMLSGAKFSMELGASLASDKVNFWTYAGASDFVRNSNVIDITFLPGSTTGTYNLFNFYSNAGTTLTAAEFSSGLSLNFTNGGSGTLNYDTLGQINLVATAIPEPSTWALLALSLTAVTILRRRRQS